MRCCRGDHRDTETQRKAATSDVSAFLCFSVVSTHSTYDIGALSKRTFAVRMTGTATPLSNVGSYCHCLMHAMAASSRRGCPEMTRISSTVPCAVSVASRTTIPLTRALDASTGYAGG